MEMDVALLDAARSGSDWKLVGRLIRRGADVNSKDEDGWTPAMFASMHGNLYMVEHLKSNRAILNVNNNSLCTALGIAVAYNRVEIVQLLVEHDDNLEMRSANGETVLLKSLDKDPRIVNALVAAGANVNVRDYRGQPALVVAVEKGNVENVKCLLKAGADPNVCTRNGITPLMESARMGLENMTRVIMRSKYGINGKPEVIRANIEARDPRGQTSLMMAIVNRHERTSRLLLEFGACPGTRSLDGNSPLKIAISQGLEKLFVPILDSGADVNEVYSRGRTALMNAALLGYDKLVRELVHRGADVQRTDSDGKAALDYAIISGNKVSIEAIIDGGAEIKSEHLVMAIKNSTPAFTVKRFINSKTVSGVSSGDTPLIAAIVAHDEGTALKIIRRGGDTVARGAIGETPLMAAARHGILPIVDKLLEVARSTIDEVNPQGSSALMIAVLNGHVTVVRDIVKAHPNLDLKDNVNKHSALSLAVIGRKVNILRLLISAGADLENENFEGFTPLILASRIGSVKMVRELVKAGANVNARSKLEITPLMVAARYNHIGVLKELMKSEELDFNARDSNKMYAWQIASKSDNPEAARLCRIRRQ